MADDNSNNFFWSKIPEEIPEILLINYGISEICILKKADSLYTALKTSTDGREKFSLNDKISEDASTSFNLEMLGLKNMGKSSLCPVFPDRPLILMFDFPFTLNPDTDISFLCSLPVAPAIVKQNPKGILKEFSTWKLSNTWSGDFESGDLCFSYNTVFHDRKDLENLKPDKAAILIHFSNKSSEAFRFYKIFLNTPSLKIFQNGRYLSSNKVDVTVSGPEQLLQYNYHDTPGREIEFDNLLTSPRRSDDKSLIRRSFRFFKNLG